MGACLEKRKTKRKYALYATGFFLVIHRKIARTTTQTTTTNNKLPKNDPSHLAGSVMSPTWFWVVVLVVSIKVTIKTPIHSPPVNPPLNMRSCRFFGGAG
jgi:hypothetical protein